MILDTLVVGIMKVNCYIAGDKDAVIIIDPGSSAEKILSHIKEHQYTVKYIVLTHCHFDHILAVNKLKEETGAKIVICSHEKDNLEDASINMTNQFSRKPVCIQTDLCVEEGDSIHSGPYAFDVLETPGHTSGGMCLYCKDENILFSGDTLFCCSIGRTDLPTGDLDALLKSVQEKLFVLSDDVKVYPGHEDATSIGFEKKNNPYFQ